jgi:L-seryl-tRNA(Ser) seleniumtransferase
LASIAAERRLCLIDLAPTAGTIDPAVHGFQSVATIANRLAAGADLVIVDGSGLVGGPACGLVIGRGKFVELVANHPLASLAAAGPLIAAALNATLELYRDAATGPLILHVPVWQQLSAPLDNLKQRAERLAPLMAECPAVTSAEAREVDSAWRRWAGREWKSKSWAIVLYGAAEAGRAFRAQLQRGPYPILTREFEGALWLDLRTVFPRWDQQLVAAITAASGA